MKVRDKGKEQIAIFECRIEHCISDFSFLMSDLAGPRPTQDSFSVVENSFPDLR